MTHYRNHAPVSNQANVQNVYGDMIINEAGDSYKRFRHDIDPSRSEQLLDEKILASLAFPQMFYRRSDIESAHPQTCQWLFDLPEYQHWKDQPRGLLWIKGKPGSGKSTIVSHLYRTLLLERRTDYEINLEFFFSARGTSLQRTFTGMLRSLLNQIYYRDPDIRQQLRATYREKCASFGSSDTAWEWTQSELERLCMDAVLASSRQVVILVDALDEAGKDAARKIAKYFHHINDRVSDSTIKICISCRHYPIPSDLQAVEVHVERHNENDITLYIKDHVRFSADQCYQNLDEVTDILTSRAQGVFQWVRLVTPMVEKWLSDGDTTDQIRTSLSEVPEGLEAVYEYILMNVIDLKFRKKSLRLFQWVCLAQRPLSVIEARYALSAEDISINTRDRPIRCHEDKDFEKSGTIMCRRIMAWSGGLVETISSEQEFSKGDPGYTGSSHSDELTIQVIHQSVNDFMVKRGLQLLLTLNGVSLGFDSNAVQVSHSVLYVSCLRYLSTEHLDPIPIEFPGWEINQKNWKIALTHHPFLFYSARYGLFHARKSGNHRGLKLEHETQLLTQCSSTWIAALRLMYNYRSSIHIETGVTVLHFAALANLETLAKYRIKRGDDLNKQDKTGWTPMHTAAKEGHLVIVDLLYKSGADLYSRTKEGETSLLLAASRGHSEIFAFLLSLGANITTSNTDSETVLNTAIAAKSLTIVRLCIEAGADVNAQGGHYGNALQEAAFGVNKDIISLLLEAGADVNAQGGEYGNALQAAAAYHNNKDVVSLLLEAGADVNAQGGPYGNALQAAAKYSGNKDTVSLLLEAGADVNAQGGEYGNALQAAARSGNKDVVSLLLKAGADVNAHGGEYGNALQAAARSGNKDVVSLLLKAGADVNAHGGEYGNALQAAAAALAYGDNKDMVSLLLEAGADVNAQGGHYGNALQAAVYDGDKDLVSLLLKAGADVNAQGGWYGNALQAAATTFGGDGDVVSLLLAAGANVNAQGGMYGNALNAAQARGQIAVVDMLIAAGAKSIEHSDNKRPRAEILANDAHDTIEHIAEEDTKMTTPDETPLEATDPQTRVCRLGCRQILRRFFPQT